MTDPTAETPAVVLEKAQAIFARNNALTLATSGAPGAPYSPWVLGAYFVHDGLDLLLFLETHGKSIKNVEHTPQVAFSVSENDAMKDFVQGRGVIEMLPQSEYDATLNKIKAKFPPFALYSPATPVRLVVQELLVSSFASQWFPARRWAR